MKHAIWILALSLTCSVSLAGTEGEPDYEELVEIENGRFELLLMDLGDVPNPLVQEDGTWIVPPDTAHRMLMIFYHYTMMPGLFREVQVRNDRLWRTVLRASLNVAETTYQTALARAAIDAGSGSWAWWEVALITGAAFVGAGLIGLAIGYGFGASTPIIVH